MKRISVSKLLLASVLLFASTSVSFGRDPSPPDESKMSDDKKECVLLSSTPIMYVATQDVVLKKYNASYVISKSYSNFSELVPAIAVKKEAVVFSYPPNGINYAATCTIVNIDRSAKSNYKQKALSQKKSYYQLGYSMKH